ncbi:MAG: hypothetical protein ACO3JL_14710 [Myxococcota bacterium]
MKFRTETRIPGVTQQELEQLYFDEEFNVAMCKAVKLARTVVKLERDDVQLTRVLRVGPERELPAPMKKALGSDRLEYEERLTYRWGSFEAHWETIPSVLPNKVESRGRILFQGVPGGVLRVAEGELNVKVFGIGGVVRSSSSLM